MRKLIAILLLASLALSATACNAKETNNETTTDNETDTDTEMVYTETDMETFTIATDIELKDRWYPEYTDHLIPSTEYGELFVFKGDEVEYKVISLDENNDEPLTVNTYLYGLCTKDGKIVVDAVYTGVAEKYGYYVLEKFDLNEIQSSWGTDSTYFLAKKDGSEVHEHPNKAPYYRLSKNGILGTGTNDGVEWVFMDISGKVVADNSKSPISEDMIITEDGQFVNARALGLSPFSGTAVICNGEVYVSIGDSTDNIETDNIEYVYGKDALNTLTATKEKYKEYDLGKLENANAISNVSKWQKLNVSGVKAVYNNMYGQDISNTNVKYGILMLNEDNTVSYISIADLIEGKGDATKLDVKNVTGIVSEDNDGYTTYLITADGNKTNVNEYIK